MIIDRYLIREISRPLVFICSVLVVIFVSYKSTVYLADVVEGVLSPNTVVSLLLLRAVIALEVLLPITLYLSVVFALGRLSADSEMTALHACGVSPGRIVTAVFLLSTFLAVCVGSLSLYARPWAYEQSYVLKARAEADLDVSRLKSKHFYQKQQGNRVIFVEHLDEKRNLKEGVFTQKEQGDTVQVIYAKYAYQDASESGTDEKVLVLIDGHEYRLSRSGTKDRIVQFDQLSLRLRTRDIDPGYKRKAAATTQLANSDNSKDIAELQWRFSTPLSTVLLGLLGIPLSRSAPRQGKYAKVVAAILIYAVYYNMIGAAKTWVEQDVVGPVPGIWWVDGLLGMLVVVLLSQSRKMRRS